VVYTEKQIIARGAPLPAEDWLDTYLHENKHRDFSSCIYCGAKTWQQHLPGMQCESILGVARYWEILKERES
jgi:hypothetical protein